MAIRHQQKTGIGMAGVHRLAFTLVELLVVITIMVCLAAMLMSSLNNAVATARSTACANNLKLISTGFANYADQTGGWIPPVSYVAGTDAPIWADEICRVGLSYTGYSASYNIASGEILRPAQMDIWNCPENATQVTRCGWSSGSGASYAINGWSHWENDTARNRPAGIRLASIHNFSELYQILEFIYFRSEATNENEGRYVFPEELQGLGVARARYQHAQGMNILYVDGHVNYIQYPLQPRGPASGSEWYRWCRR